MTQKVRKTIARLLTAFLLVSIGVAIGKEMAFRSLPEPAGPAVAVGETKVVVYYMHGYPCPDCTTVHQTAQKVISEHFADAAAAGEMEFIPVNYLLLENESLADRYDVGGNMVIALRFEDGREVARVRLPRTLELAGQPDELEQYLADGIRSVLDGDDS